MKEYVLRPAAAKTGSVDYARDLNSQQLEVVMAGGGPLLVIAGAGSGKTRTLTYRVARLVESGVSPGQILVLTFTNKAAREMLRRVETLVGGDPRRIVGGTFHHVGNLVLRHHAELHGFRSNFTILDREDSRELMSDVTAAFRDRHEPRRFPKGDVVLDLSSQARNRDVPLTRFLETRHPVYEEVRGEIVQAANRYAARKQDLNFMDFDDLLLFWRDLLRDHPEIREEQHRRWRYLLVDEYQDTNRVQSEIVERIAGEDGNLMVVGDDAQSIYSFRGAEFANIIEFPERHPATKSFKLETNYRSTPEILALANSSIANNSRQFPKALSAVRASGELPEAVAAGDATEQARFVVQRILELQDEGIPLGEIAVLYRAHYHSMELQMELDHQGVPYQVRSGLRFFEQAHVKDVTAYLKVVSNVKDELAWKRLLKHVPRVGKATAAKIWAMIQLDAFGEVKKSLPKGAQKGWEELMLLVGKLRDLTKTPGEMIRAVVDGGYEAHAEANFSNYNARLDDLRRFADFAVRYEDVTELLAELALTSGVAGKDAMEERDAEETLVLSTVHQAKGLEWRAVFLLWMVEGKFPDGRALREDGGEEEERRLFYVAATRAKDRLCLVHPTIADERMLHGVIQRQSRFLQELAPETYEEATITFDPFGE